MVLIKKNLSNEKNLVLDNLTINEGLNGSFSIAPSNIQTQPPGVLTVNEISKLIGTQGGLVDTNTNNQQIQNPKIFNSACKTNISTGYFAVRENANDSFFVHTLSYDTPSASILACSSDEQSIDTGFIIGCKSLNNKASTTIKKLHLKHRGSQPDSTILELEENVLVSMNATANNKFNLRNINSINIGGSSNATSSINISKTGNAEITVNSSGNASVLNLSGIESEIKVGPNFRIYNNTTNPESFNFYKNGSDTFANYNSTSGCLSIGDNNGSAGMSYGVLNCGVNNKILKVPNMTTAQQSTFIGQLSGSTYLGGVFLNSQSNRLCFVDNNNVLHKVGGSIASSNTITNTDDEFIVGNSSDETKQMKFSCAGITTGNTRILTVPDENITLASTDTQQIISGAKTYTSNLTVETALNNNDVIRVKSTTGSITGISIENSFSADKVKINKNNDDISFVIANIERAKISGNDLDLPNGGDYLKNGTSLKNVSEILQNKTISFGSNTLQNVMSTNTAQSITANKNYGFENLRIDNAALTKYNKGNSDPTSSDDLSNNYSVGSKFLNTNSMQEFVCIDNSISLAKWQNVSENIIPANGTFSTSSTVYQYFLVFTPIKNKYYKFIKFTADTLSGTGSYISLYNYTTSTEVQVIFYTSVGEHVMNISSYLDDTNTYLLRCRCDTTGTTFIHSIKW